jgi:hypothetical protein
MANCGSCIELAGHDAASAAAVCERVIAAIDTPAPVVDSFTGARAW